jgi:hypothetical protein
MIPDVNGGGSDFNLEMAELSLSTANAGDGTAGKARVSMVPIGALGSPWQPFMESEHD